MTDRPLLFSPPMVRAYMAGRKTQTRRVVTWRNSLVNGYGVNKEYWEKLDYLGEIYIDPGPSIAGYPGSFFKFRHREEGTLHRIYPRAEAGNRFWVREALFREGYMTYYEADCLPVISGLGQMKWRWKRDKLPAMFMPRKASRHTLDITAVRAERVQDISNSDAMNEGIQHWYMETQFDENAMVYWHPMNGSGAALKFSELWNSINESRGYSWDTNPPVWVYEFPRYEP